MRCRRCNEDLPESEFRQMRKQRHGVCKVCEARDNLEYELRARERRAKQSTWGEVIAFPG